MLRAKRNMTLHYFAEGKSNKLRVMQKHFFPDQAHSHGDNLEIEYLSRLDFIDEYSLLGEICTLVCYTYVD